MLTTGEWINFLKHFTSLWCMLLTMWYKLRFPYLFVKHHQTSGHEIFNLLHPFLLTSFWTVGDTYHCSWIITAYIGSNMAKPTVTRAVRKDLGGGLFCFVFFLTFQSISPSIWSDSLRTHGLLPDMLLYPWDSPGKNTGVSSYPLFQGLFPAQGWKLGLPYCRQILHSLRNHGSSSVW